MQSSIQNIILSLKKLDGVGDKETVITRIQKEHKLTKDGSVYYNDFFAIRFCYSASGSFSNTVLSLSNLKKYDHNPFIVCLITKEKNICYLANTTFLEKISHSSKDLREDNIRGSFNGSDIMKEFAGYKNEPAHFDFLFASHREILFEENLARLVQITNNIQGTGKKFVVEDIQTLLDSIRRTKDFLQSKDYQFLKNYLDSMVDRYHNEILIAGFIENINIRGRIIEYLIAGEDEQLRKELIEALHAKSRNIPQFQTKNDSGDFVKIFDKYHTATDIKTKIMILQSNPKAYNIDKMLAFLSQKNTVFLFYFIGVDPSKIVGTTLVSIFQKDLLQSTIFQHHRAGRNSRGVAQFNGHVIHHLIEKHNNDIDEKASIAFLKQMIEM